MQGQTGGARLIALKLIKRGFSNEEIAEDIGF